MQKKELMDLPKEELEVVYHDTRKELYELRSEYKLTKKLERPHLIREKRKHIARILTLLNQKTKAENKVSN